VMSPQDDGTYLILAGHRRRGRGHSHPAMLQVRPRYCLTVGRTTVGLLGPDTDVS
jgi:hypothetical protein